LAFLALPSLALASSAASFAPQSIFLSQSPVTEGDTVRIYAITTNPSDAKFSGTVTLSESGSEIGAVAVTLAAGATQTASIVWKPLAGSHTITATLKADDGATAQTKQQTFVVESPPPPVVPTATSPAGGSAATAAVESSQTIQEQIQNVSPQAASAAAPVFAAIDSVRQAIANAADQQIAQTQPKITPVPLPGSTGSPQGGQVEGASTEAPATTNWMWSIVYTLYFYILTLVRFVVGSAGVFYPVLAVAFLYFLWKMFRRFRRPAY